jgi:tetratricopeptide (TPR) repeat protein/TolB-like protein/predicted Ser/Thr protein kinase
MAESSSSTDDGSSHPSSSDGADESLQGLVVGRFRIENRVGRGGMGEVYRALDTRLKRQVALKRLTPALRNDPLYRRRFLEEAENASRLSDPHVAAIYDVLDENGEIFLVMEFVEGETLRQRLTRPVTLEIFFDIGTQCAEALIAAHRAGVVHGDIKPENIMLTPDGQVKILDFGLAKNLPSSEESATIDRAGTFAGTPAYMAPEVLMEIAPDGRADIFSLGVVFYEVLTARHPFHANSFMATCDRIRRENPAPIRTLNANVPAQLQEIVTEMLAKSPGKRYASAHELLQDLRYVQQTNSHPELVISSLGRVPLWKRILIPAVASVLGAGLLLSAYASAPVQRWLTGPPKQQRIFLAVLPFAPAAGDANSRAFSDGVTEALTMRLTQLTASYPVEIVGPREIRAEDVQDAEHVRKTFGAGLALEGSLSQSDHMIRVSYSLVDTATRRQLHADTVTVDDVRGPLSLEDRLVESIVSMLGIELRPNDKTSPSGRGTGQPAAYDYYLRGRGFLQDYQKEDNLSEAISAFQQALELDPGFALASAGLGEAYWHKYERAREPQWVEKALANCQRAEMQAANLPNGHVCLGVVYNGTGEHENAVQEFQKALSVDSTNDDAFRGLASAYEKLDRLDEAEQTYQKAIQLRPQYWAGYAWLGGFYNDRGRYDDAARMYTEWIALAPDSYQGYNNLGAMYLSQGRYGDAVPQFRRSADIKPTLDSYSNLGTAYFYQGSFADAARAYQDAVRVGENDADAYIAVGNLAEAYYWAPGERDEALKTYRRAITLADERLRVNPHDAHALSSRGLYHAMLQQKDVALTEIRQVLQLAPNDPEFRLDAAKAEAQLGDNQAALAALESARKLGVQASLVRDDPAFRVLAANVQFQKLARP